MKTSNKYNIARTKRHNYRKENLSTKSKTPLNEEIYVRLEMQMHASTHATMLRRQLTFKPKTKKIKFLGRRKVEHATCDGREWKLGRKTFLLALLVSETLEWIFVVIITGIDAIVYNYSIPKHFVDKNIIYITFNQSQTTVGDFLLSRSFPLTSFWLNRHRTEIFDAFDNQVISISEEDVDEAEISIKAK